MSGTWETVATSLRFTDEKTMWTELYETRKLSISILANKFAASPHTIRARLLATGIILRKRGGPNGQKIDITQEVLDQVLKVGVPKTAKLLGVTAQTLYRRLYYQHGMRKRDLLKQVEDASPVAEKEVS